MPVRSTRNWKIQFRNETRNFQLPSAQVKKIARAALSKIESKIPKYVSELSIVITTDAKIRALNSKYRRKNKPTDVLSFPQVVYRKQKNGDRSPFLGDVVISHQTMVKQARHYGVSNNAEFVRLLTHGILHLAGYDHEKVPFKEAQRMFRKERAVCIYIMRAAKLS